MSEDRSGGGGRGWRLVRASTDAVPASVRRVFMAARRRGRLRRPAARPWAPVAAVLALVLLAGWVLWGTSLLGVRQVRVTGTGILSPAEVRQAASVPDQTPLLRVRPGEVADRVGALAPVARVEVRRAWPHTLAIEVVERTAAAAVPTTDGFALIDGAGVVFQTVSQAPGDLPVVVLAEPGPDDPATAAGLAVLAALTPELRGQLESLTVAGPARIELALASGWTVVWGDRTASARKARVATALLDRDGEVIDVSVPEVVSVR